LEKPTIVRIFTHNIKKETNMKINKANITHIHELLIENLKLRLHKSGKGTVYMNDTELEYQLESLVSTVEHTNTISDINDVVIEYGELFKESYDSEDIFTLEGTMNYVLNLALEYYTRFKHKSLYRPEFN
jgi:hypothetical protein